MPRRSAGLLLGVAAAASATVLLSAGQAPAAESDAVLSTGAANPAGTNVAVGDTLTGGLAPGTTATLTARSAPRRS